MPPNDSSKQSITQLSLFDVPGFDNKQPLPLLTAEKWKFPLTYIDVDGNVDNYLYACQDWVVGLGGTKSRWRHMKNELARSTRDFSTTAAPYTIPDGRTYQSDYTTAQGLYIIAGEMRSTKQRPQLNDIKQYLAKAGVIVDTLRRDEKARAAIGVTASDEALADAKQQQSLEAGASEHWAQERSKLLTSTHDVRDTIDALAEEPINYGRFHNTQYQSTTGHDAKTLREITGKKNPRDGLGLPALETLNLSNALIDAAVSAQSGVDNEGLDDIVHDTSDPLGAHLENMARKYGFDKITGKPLLRGGQ